MESPEELTCSYCGAVVECEQDIVICQCCTVECCVKCIVSTDLGERCQDCYDEEDENDG
jgi:hypothetical protein